ncbi:MAG: DUF2971 domain-containing protein [Acidobacteriia bacterium]|nr:DUF2971 domain-containing protein [Terriglobia bacterium]
MNDSTEYSLALKLAQEVIQRRIEDAGNNFDRGLYKVLEERLAGEEGHGEVYVSSFTENGDQLSQWRAYSPPTGGFAIGFRSKSLTGLTEANPDRFLAPCTYEALSQKDLISHLINTVEKFAEESNAHNRLNHDRVFRESFKLLGRLLPLTAPALKDASFAEEKEWRLVRLPSSFEEGKLQFREGRSMLIPYNQHFFPDNHGSLPIEELVVGPTPHPELAREAAQALLMTHGLTTAIVQLSSIPYRTW